MVWIGAEVYSLNQAKYPSWHSAWRFAIERKADARAVLLLLLLLLLLSLSLLLLLLSHSFIFLMTCLVVKSFLIIVSRDKVFNNNNNYCHLPVEYIRLRFLVEFSLFVSFIFVCTRAETFSWEDKNLHFKANFSPLLLMVKLCRSLCYISLVYWKTFNNAVLLGEQQTFIFVRSNTSIKAVLNSELR